MSHEWDVQHQAWNGGAMDNWVPAHMASDGATDGQYTMGYFTREDIPFQYALAEAFTILDGYHCSVLGPTAPNRHMWMSGTIDPNGLAGGPSLTTSGPSNQFSWTTYMERLQAAGISWKIYRQPGSLTGAAAISKWTQFGTAQPGNPLVRQRRRHPAARPVRVRLPERSAAGRELDPAAVRIRRAPGRPASRRCDLRGRQDRRDRRQPGCLGQDRVHPVLRRERRHVRPRAAADAVGRNAR